MCDIGFAHDCHHTERDTNVRGGWSVLQWRDDSGIANDIDQRHHRYMGSGDQQHGYDYLHVHANSRSVCDDDAAHDYHHAECDTSVRSGWSVLQWCFHTGIANDIDEWHYRNLGSGDQQHGDDYLHVYA